MRVSPLFDQWMAQQSHWDDDEFLGTLSRLQVLRYKRLNERVSRALEEAAREGWASPRLVDAGCGHADFRSYLPSVWRYVGVDPSPEQLAHALQADPKARLIQGAAECLPLRAASCEAVLLKEVLDHSFDPSAVFQEAARVLKPGGLLVVTLTNDRSWFKRLLPGINRRLKEKQKDHFHFFGPADLARLAGTERFDRVRVQTYNHLKLPGFFEGFLGFFGDGFQRFLLATTDAVGRGILPGLGGGMMLTARKNLEGGATAVPPLETPLSQPSPVSNDLLEILVCPACGSAIRPKGDELECTSCRRVFPVKEGIPSLMPEASKGA